MTWLYQRIRSSCLYNRMRGSQRVRSSWLYQRMRWWRMTRKVRRTYNQQLQRPLHLFRPRRFTEKMQWRKLFDLDPIYVVFCDKVATRDYVSQRVGSDAVVQMLWLGSDPVALPFDKLRPPYIIKCSHGSGMNIVVRGNDNDYAAIRTQLGRWLAIDYGIELYEPGYCAVPHRLLVEPLLTHQGGFPIEYKFFMFDGVTLLIMLQSITGIWPTSASKLTTMCNGGSCRSARRICRTQTQYRVPLNSTPCASWPRGWRRAAIFFALIFWSATNVST